MSVSRFLDVILFEAASKALRCMSLSSKFLIHLLTAAGVWVVGPLFLRGRQVGSKSGCKASLKGSAEELVGCAEASPGVGGPCSALAERGTMP